MLPFPHQQTIFLNFMQLLDCAPCPLIGTKHPLSSAAAEEEGFWPEHTTAPDLGAC